MIREMPTRFSDNIIFKRFDSLGECHHVFADSNTRNGTQFV